MHYPTSTYVNSSAGTNSDNHFDHLQTATYFVYQCTDSLIRKLLENSNNFAVFNYIEVQHKTL